MAKPTSYVLLLFLWFNANASTADAKPNDIPKECKERFLKSKLSAGKQCSMDCALLPVDMGTFDCGRFCEDYCDSLQEKEPSNFAFQLSALYPGLTSEERKFVDRNPQKALHAYWLSWRAERICNKVYLVSDTNDESDACRHYIWASLLNTKYGQALTSELLDAHEQNPDEAEAERSMDLANNRRGVIASSELIKSKKIEDSDFLNQFHTDLKNGKIIVIKRKKK